MNVGWETTRYETNTQGVSAAVTRYDHGPHPKMWKIAMGSEPPEGDRVKELNEMWWTTAKVAMTAVEQFIHAKMEGRVT